MSVIEEHLDNVVDPEKPLSQYEPETTLKVGDVDVSSFEANDKYPIEATDVDLSERIAQITVENDGRVPTEFSPDIQSSNRSSEERFREWAVYAPQTNPHEIASALSEFFKSVSAVTPASENASYVTITETGQLKMHDILKPIYATDHYEEPGILAMKRMYRWWSGMPDEIVEDLKQSDLNQHAWAIIDDWFGYGHGKSLSPSIRHAGDAWDMHKLSIRVRERSVFYPNE